MPKIKGHTKYLGYYYKLCPYSTAYKNRFYDNGFAGNTTNEDIQDNFIGVTTADHTETEGTMNYFNRGGAPGWICYDEACPYFTTNGQHYFEI